LLNKEPADCSNCGERKNRYSKWTCEHCGEFRFEQISRQTWHLLEMRRLKSAGFPLKADELDYVSWHLLAALEEKIEAGKSKRGIEYG